ncbi:MAG: SRPBCC domain-containing protein [Candidatus Nanopelagicales bacterium]|nr:SRPBCC domain-containing protein [Candidatus Nanopelagicales bacterium]
MTVTAVVPDPEGLTLTVTAEFAADVERAWQLWSDPRQLERWWGPPTYPATVVEHDLRPGGLVTYFMTGPEGDTPGGLWRVLEVEPPKFLLLEDAFADADGNPIEDLPKTLTRVRIAAREAGGSVMTIESVFPSLESMEQLTAMGMVEGITQAVGQMDAILAA